MTEDVMMDTRGSKQAKANNETSYSGHGAIATPVTDTLTFWIATCNNIRFPGITSCSIHKMLHQTYNISENCV